MNVFSDYNFDKMVFDASFPKKEAGYDVVLTTRRSPVQFRSSPSFQDM